MSNVPVPFAPTVGGVGWPGSPQVSGSHVGQYAGIAPAQQSVVAALAPTRPASSWFWIGLVLTILALVMVACPALLAFAVVVDARLEESGRVLQGALGVSCCVFMGLLVPGVVMVFAGRPRRYS
jgi:hypothetical protein